MSELMTILSHDSGITGIVLGVAVGLRALARVVCAWIEQSALTRRFDRALEGAEPSERAKIIRSVLDAGHNGTGTHGTDR